jgi:tetratricopeptide (TPR) repeat protein
MILNLTEELPPLTKEEVCQVFINTLDLLSGFSILFLQCSPAEANQLIPRVRQEFPKKNIEVLDLVKPIDNLYKLVEGRADRTSLNILFVRGLEKSLEADVKPGYKGLGDYYNLNTVPPILSHLNQQRENFRDHFGNICFVFVLPKFAIRYFVRRAPDFYDWNSGLFKMSDQRTLEQFLLHRDELYSSKNLPEPEVHNIKLSSHSPTQTWHEKFSRNFSRLWSNDSKSAQKFVAEGIVLLEKKRYEEAITLFNKAIDVKPYNHNAWNNRGNALYNLGRYKEAVTSYDRVIEIKPYDYEALNNRGNALCNLGYYEKAIASYDRNLILHLDDYEAWHNRGNALYNLGHYEKAIASYERAVAFNPNKHEAWCNRGNSLSNLGRYEEAIASYDRTVAINPNENEAWCNRGNALHELGRYEEAIASYDRAVVIDPNVYEVWRNRGASLGNLGRYEEVITSYERALTINPDDHEAWYNRGISLDNLGRQEEAISSYDRAVAINPDDYEAWHNRGISLGELGHYEESIYSYDQAVSIKRNYSEAWHNKGWTYFKWGKYPESIICYERVIDIKSNDYHCWHNKGLTQLVTGNYVDALASWQQAFNYIRSPEVPRYYEDISGLIQEFIKEFIKELIPRFTQPPIQQTLLIPLLVIYKESNVITELGAALVNTLHLIVAPTISDHTANQWLTLWRTSSLGNEPAMELPLRLMNTAIEYKKDPSKRQRLWLNLPSEERPILDQALKFLD